MIVFSLDCGAGIRSVNFYQISLNSTSERNLTACQLCLDKIDLFLFIFFYFFLSRGWANAGTQAMECGTFLEAEKGKEMGPSLQSLEAI